MARDDLVALCAGGFLSETAEFKLTKIRAGLNYSVAKRTLPRDTKIIECVMMWGWWPWGRSGDLVPAGSA
jgi:hypothetical protein